MQSGGKLYFKYGDEETVFLCVPMHFRRPNPKLDMYPPPLEQTERVSNAKLLGITLNENLRFDIHAVLGKILFGSISDADTDTLP